jgi:hypothetical protein
MLLASLLLWYHYSFNMRLAGVSGARSQTSRGSTSSVLHLGCFYHHANSAHLHINTISCSWHFAHA